MKNRTNYTRHRLPNLHMRTKPTYTVSLESSDGKKEETRFPKT
jgi:hypothetical protein